MMTKKKWIALICLFSLCVLIFLPKQKTLRIGIFVGSYWDVPSGEGYHIIDEAVARFEQSHPGVKVEYVSGIRKDDYSQWLSDQIMLGKEPDV